MISTGINPLKYLFAVFFSLFIFSVNAQQKFTISGKVRDKDTGEALIGALIVVKDLQNTGAIANEYGFYSITLPKGTYTLASSFVGYQVITKNVILDKTQSINWNLQSGTNLQTVEVVSSRSDKDLTRSSMGVERLNIIEISKLPVLFGEKDVLKTIQLLPGVKSAGEGNSGFYVRGGSGDQNLILLDEATVYNASHLMGFFSTFNSDAIQDATLLKGNGPAQYGGRLASVLDIKMKEGNQNDYTVNGGIGLISSRISVEGPIQNEKSSFLLSGRRTYADMFLKLSEKYKDNSLFFYDLNAKANYQINAKNRLYISGYFGKDKLGVGDLFGIDWGNTTGTLRWNSIIAPRVFSNTSFIYSDYNYNINITSGSDKFNINSEIQDWNLKQEFQFFPSTKNSWRFGVNSIYHTITPSRFSGESTQEVKASRYSWENAIYANNSFTAGNRLGIDYGIRLSSFSILGGDTYNIYENGMMTNSISLAKGTFGKTYFNIEPRISANYRIDEVSSIKSAYARNTQNVHLLSNSTSSSPTDQWIGDSYNIKPEIGDQLSLGYFRNIAGDNYEMSLETYYKWMQNQVDYKNGADIYTSPDVESELLYGVGRAYGLELLLKKKTGRFTGWISYTLARTERKVDGINNNNWYLAKQDRLHDLTLVGMYQLNTKWSLSALFVYYTGNAVTFPSGKYVVDGNTVFLYTERNGYRMPAYHRLDIGATYESKREGRYQSSWNIGCYNVYGHENAYVITFADDPDDPSRTQATQIALFKWIPSVTYNFKF